MGTHKDLLERKGIYYHLVTTQVGDDLTTTDQLGENELRRQSEQDDNYAVQHAEQEKVVIFTMSNIIPKALLIPLKN